MQVDVAAALIFDDAGRVLLTRRPNRGHQPGKWELPGGKRESGETIEQALVRELREELAILVQRFRLFMRVSHRYPERMVRLHVCRVDAYLGTAAGQEGQPMRWWWPSQIDAGILPAADVPIVKALRLPEYCFVTSDEIASTPNPGYWLDALPDDLAFMVRLRCRGATASDYRRFLANWQVACSDRGVPLMVNCAGQELVEWIGIAGCHLSHAQLGAGINRDHCPPGLLLGASCHDVQSLRQALDAGVDYVFLSPVKHTLSHPDASPLGWHGFAQLVEELPLPVFALGGMTASDLARVKQHGGFGVAAMRGFYEANEMSPKSHTGSG
jgi:8-oxo-dGTP diphosphatase